MKLDADGNKLWEKAFGSEWLHESGPIHDVRQTTDGGFMFCGIMETSKGENAWMIKTDADGNKLWGQIFEGDWFSSTEIEQGSDGGYVLLGTICTNDTWFSDSILIKTDANGNTLWDKKFGSRRYNYGKSVEHTTDGGYIACGSSLARDTFLIKTDSDGNKLWDKKSNGKLDGQGDVVRQALDDGYIVCGSIGPLGDNTHRDIWLAKTDTEGNMLWDKKFGSGGDTYCKSVEHTTDCGYIICGNSEYYLDWLPVGERLWLIKTDANGNKLWSKTFGGILHNYRGYSAQQTTDGGYIVHGRHDGGATLWKIAPVRSRCPFF